MAIAPSLCGGISRRRRAAAPLAVVAAAVALTSNVPALCSTVAAPSSVPVATSRGELTLLLYSPDSPHSHAPAAASSLRTCDAERPLILFISGEGGWRHFDDQVSAGLREAGYWVGGVDAMKYFWEPQDSRQALASDIRAYVAALAAEAGRDTESRLVLAGFSFGADLAPWLAGEEGWGSRVKGLLMIGPDEVGSLEFRFSEILGFSPEDHVFKVAEALHSAAGVPVVFVHGEKDSSSFAPLLAEKAAEPKRLIVVGGADHHFSGEEAALMKALLEALAWIEGTH